MSVLSRHIAHFIESRVNGTKIISHALNCLFLSSTIDAKFKDARDRLKFPSIQVKNFYVEIYKKTYKQKTAKNNSYIIFIVQLSVR